MQWVSAMDQLLHKMKSSGFRFDQVRRGDAVGVIVCGGMGRLARYVSPTPFSCKCRCGIVGQVKGVSGSGQQHGSVYLRTGAEATMRGVKPNTALAAQVASMFSVEESPIWADSSTTKQCQALEAALGGAQAVAALTGSR